MRPTQKNNGFTIVELVIAIPIIVIVMVVVLGFLLTLLQDFSTQRTRQTLNVAGQSALQQIESDVKLSSAFQTAIDTATFTDPYGPNGPTNNSTAWSFKGSSATARTLILKTYATDKNPLADVRSPVYINQVGCTGDQKLANEVLSNTVIYFVRNENLYRRVLTVSSPPATCNTAFQVQTCPPEATSRPSSCIIDDTILLSKVSEFIPSYYISSVSPTPVDAYSTTNAAILDNTMAVEVSIKHGQAGSPVINSAKLRTTRLN